MAQRSRDHRASAGLNTAQGPPVATYQTRVSGYVGLDREAGDAALATYAELYGQVERKLFAEVAAGRSAAPLKRDYIREHGIPARLFNAVRVSLEGKVSAVPGGAAVAGGQPGAANCSRGTAGCEGRGTGSVAAGSPEAAAVGQSSTQAGWTGGRHCGGPGAAVLRVEAVVAQAASP